MSNENFEWVTISKIEFFRSNEGGTKLLNSDGSVKLITIMREHWLRLQKEIPAIEKTNNQPTDKE